MLFNALKLKRKQLLIIAKRRPRFLWKEHWWLIIITSYSSTTFYCWMVTEGRSFYNKILATLHSLFTNIYCKYKVCQGKFANKWRFHSMQTSFAFSSSRGDQGSKWKQMFLSCMRYVLFTYFFFSKIYKMCCFFSDIIFASLILSFLH